MKRAGYTYEARQLVETALKENHRRFQIWSRCVEFDLLFGNLQSAAQRLQDYSTDVATERSRVHLLQGRLAEAQGKLEAAKGYYDLAVKVNSQDAEARAELFRACLLSLDIEEAREHLEAWTQLNIPSQLPDATR